MAEKKGTENNGMEKIISLAKRRGFVYQGSEIYGGLAGTWDYGPLGVALKRNIERLWWKRFVDDREDMYGVDAAILMNQNVWKASGHVAGFSDPLVECLNCNRRQRVDQLVDEAEYKKYLESLDETYHAYMNGAEFKGPIDQLVAKHNISPKAHQDALLETHISVAEQVKDAKSYIGRWAKVYLEGNIDCPFCNKRKWGEPRKFNMMLKTHVGAIEDDSSISYLRPETAGGMFVNFKNVVDSFHPKLPFGLAQIGKAFRNEIAPRDFLFRVRELEQMEIEYFVKPATWAEHFESFRQQVWEYTKDVGLSEEKVHELEVADADRAHYSKRTIDFEFDFPFGRKELYGLAYRTDFDLKSHSEASKQDLSYFEEGMGERFLPHVIEPSFGVGRTFLAVLADAYTEDTLGDEPRAYLKFHPRVAPVKVAVFPLLKNKPELVKRAYELFQTLRKTLGAGVVFDDNGNIGKRYRRQDEIGTPFCVTVDFDTIEKDAGVTVRDRDTGKQERISTDTLMSYLQNKLG